MKKVTEKINQRTSSFSSTNATSSPSYLRNPQKKTSAKPQDLQKRIEEKAYELYERRGYSHGNDLADWLEAERMIKAQDN